jgi:hypothetical protein
MTWVFSFFCFLWALPLVNLASPTPICESNLTLNSQFFSSGRAGNRHSGIAIREWTELPPFYKQIQHLIWEIKTAKRKNKPLLIEGPPGLGKGTALQQWVSEEGQNRPAIYLQLSMVLRKRHGGSSIEDDDEHTDEFYTETETETEGLEERIHLTVRRDAWKKALERALGVSEDEGRTLRFL